MAAGAQSIIEATQPFNRSDGPPDLHPLWLLHDLSNEDKHRKLVIVGATMQELVDLQAHTDDGHAVSLNFEITPQAFDDGMVVGYIDAVSMDPLLARIPITRVLLTMSPKFNVAFSREGPGRGLIVAPAIVGIANFVSKIAIDLEPYLPDPKGLNLEPPSNWVRS